MKKILAAILTALTLLCITATVCSAEASAESVTEENFFSAVYAEITEHSGEILSALAFIGSLIIAFTYKRGLLPLLKSGLNGLLTAVGKIKEDTERGILSSSDSALYLKDKLSKTEELIEGLATAVTELEDKLRGKEEAERINERARIIMEAQVDLLYEIFMSSSLPQYTKDRVGEKIAEMKISLAPVEKTEE